jgi:hypothetical protein
MLSVKQSTRDLIHDMKQLSCANCLSCEIHGRIEKT